MLRLKSAVVAAATGGLLVASTALAGPASAVGTVEVLLDGLSSPKGVALAPTKYPAVAQGAFGAPGPVITYDISGKDEGTVREKTDPAAAADLAYANDGALWTIEFGENDEQWLVRYHNGREVVADLAQISAAHPDPYDTEGDPGESNPYGLSPATNGAGVLVANAANNAIFHVSKAGNAHVVARFATESISTDHVTDEQWESFEVDPAEAPPFIDAEAVPTSVTIGEDGAIYVGELKGFPFRPGSSRVWRIPAGANDALCSANPDIPSAGGCTSFRSGLTSIQDIKFRNGGLLVLELAEGGTLAFEGGCFGPDGCPPGVLLEIRPGGQTREIAEGEIQGGAGGITIGKYNRIYVTDGVFGDGRLLRITL